VHVGIYVQAASIQAPLFDVASPCSPYEMQPVNEGTEGGGGGGRVALVERGQCTFLEKIRLAEAAGASALLVYDNELTQGVDFVPGTTQRPTIPVIPVSRSFGLALVERLRRAEDVSISIQNSQDAGDDTDAEVKTHKLTFKHPLDLVTHMGNTLSRYWHNRALARFRDAAFHMRLVSAGGQSFKKYAQTSSEVAAGSELEGAAGAAGKQVLLGDGGAAATCESSETEHWRNKSWVAWLPLEVAAAGGGVGGGAAAAADGVSHAAVAAATDTPPPEAGSWCDRASTFGHECPRTLRAVAGEMRTETRAAINAYFGKGRAARRASAKAKGKRKGKGREKGKGKGAPEQEEADAATTAAIGVEARGADAVIHFRCGDVIRASHAEYGFLRFAWYAQHIPSTARRVVVVGNFGGKPKPRVKGWRKGKAKVEDDDDDEEEEEGGEEEGGGGGGGEGGGGSRAVDRASDRTCQQIGAEFGRFLRQRLKPQGAAVQFASGGSVNSDFAALATAKVLLGSVSTFSLMAGLANPHGHVVLPRCPLFFKGRAPAFEGVRWEPAEQLRSADMARMDAKTIVDWLVGRKAKDAAEDFA
jgi:hypothetical protein